MFANRFFILLGNVALMLVILLSVPQVLARPAAAADMDSAAQSYSAWAKAAEVESIDSATRSSKAWALEVEAAAVAVTGNSVGQNIAVPVTGASDYVDNFQRHSEQPDAAIPPIDECFDVSLSELAACRQASQ